MGGGLPSLHPPERIADETAPRMAADEKKEEKRPDMMD